MSGQEIISSNEVAKSELQELLNISEIIWNQECVFERLHDLALSQREVKRINPEVFTGIQNELVLLHQLWGEHYLTVFQSIGNDVLPWLELRKSSDGFFYALMTDEGPSVRLQRHGLNDGDGGFLSLEICDFNRFASIYSELLGKDQWFRRVGHTFKGSLVRGDQISRLSFEFKATQVSQDRPEDCIYREDSMSVESERKIEPLASLNSPDRKYCPSDKESFRLHAKRLPVSVSLEGTTFLEIGFNEVGDQGK
jgi:hypothetical protein